MSSVAIRSIERLHEVRLVEELQKEVWGMQDRDIVPLTEMVAVRDSGGQLIGAFDGEVLVGFVYGFVAMERGETVHHSHLLAVKPSHRGRDLGYRLKLAQRERVIAQGITRMTWTFDPLQSVNAHFNFGRLGVVSDRYQVDLYGDQSSSFLHRNGTDRLWVTWLLTSPRVAQRLRGAPAAKAPAAKAPAAKEAEAEANERRLVVIDGDGAPVCADAREGYIGARAWLEIPADVNALERERPECASRWRRATRAAFGAALEAGFVVENFFRSRDGARPAGVYLLERGRTVEDFDEHSS